MATETPNYKLKKPAQEDFYNVDDFNENADIIDAELKKNANNLTQVQTDVTAHLADNVRHLDYATASGTNTYTATIDGVKALVEGVSFKVKFTNANTGASTLNINGLGAKSIRKGNGNTLVSGNIKAGQILHLVYTGSNFQILGEGGSGNLKPNQALAGFTFTNDDGDQVGTGDPNLKPENIRKDTTVFGVTGSLGVAHGGLRQDISLVWEHTAKVLVPSGGGAEILTVYPLTNGDAIVVTEGGFFRITKQGTLVYFVDFYKLYSKKITQSAIDLTGNYLAFTDMDYTGSYVRTFNVNGTLISYINTGAINEFRLYSLAVDTKGKAVYSYSMYGYSSVLDYEGLYSYKTAPVGSNWQHMVDANGIVYSVPTGLSGVGAARITTAMTVTNVGTPGTQAYRAPLAVDTQYFYLAALNGNDMRIEKINLVTSQIDAIMYTARWANTGVPYYGDCRHRNNLLLIKMRVYSDIGAFNHYHVRTDFRGHNFMDTRKADLTTVGGMRMAYHISGDDFYIIAGSGSNMVIGYATIKNEIVL